VAIKAAVVADDEQESGRRAVLNAGHTVAHAIEQVTNYATPHGEAVAMGLVAECRLGERLGVTEPGTADRVAAVLTALNLPAWSAPPDLTALIKAMRFDKKSVGGELRFAFPARVGEADRDEESWTRAVGEVEVEGGLRA
jgi:3-dehydroquinate synthase